MSEMKYYIGKIWEQHGEFECYETVLFKTDELPAKYLAVLAWEWYDLNPSLEHLLTEAEEAKEFFEEFVSDNYFFWNDCMTYCASFFKEVPKDIWDFLQDKRIHSDLYITGEGNSVENWIKLEKMYLEHTYE